MSFHALGDSGGLNDRAPQALVAKGMAAQFKDAAPGGAPGFMFHLGDVVYDFGSAQEYYRQFYYPYRDYPAPIFAIPGNHDGDVDPFDRSAERTLAPFMRAFCSAKAITPPEARYIKRGAMVQPNVFFTLLTPFARIVALYTNVPEYGVVTAEQRDWALQELRAAAKEGKGQALILALHNAPYSYDWGHGESLEMQGLLDDLFEESGVYPDLVLSGHVHNYQRFRRKMGDREITYLVAGAGGYYNLHKVYPPVQTSLLYPTLEAYQDESHGFLNITVDGARQTIEGKYFIVHSRDLGAPRPVTLFDSFEVKIGDRTARRRRG